MDKRNHESPESHSGQNQDPGKELEVSEEIIETDITENQDDPEEQEAISLHPAYPQKIEHFEDASLDTNLLEKILKMGWKAPTEVQALCLPHTLRGKDVAGFAQTGTGKTGVFLITLCQSFLSKRPENYSNKQNGKATPFCVVIAPTRELALQIQGDAEQLLGSLGISSIAVFGGIDYEKQARKLTEGVDLIVATPGRLIDYYQKHLIDLSKCGIFVCDEVDRMFDMGFVEDVEFFLDRLPENTQKLLFSATTNPNVKELAFKYLEKPEYISVNPEMLTPESIEQLAIICDSSNKLKVMLGLLQAHNPVCAIIFTNTKLTAEWLHYKLTHNNIEADLITGDLPQQKRIRLIERIKKSDLKVLIATDVASRGLHITRVTHVYNFDLPDEAANYVHRVGRTARSGAKGYAYSLVCDDYGHNLVAINELLGPELALKSDWFDQGFLSIEDKSGDPFHSKNRDKAQFSFKRETSEPSRQDHQSRPRNRDGDRDRHRDRDRGRDRDRDRNRDRRPRQSREQEGQRQDAPRSQMHPQKRPEKARDQRSGRSYPERKHGSEGRQIKQSQNNIQQDGKRKDQGPPKSDKRRFFSKPEPTSIPSKQLFVDKTRTDLVGEVPNTLGGILKKVVQIIFKKKKD